MTNRIVRPMPSPAVHEPISILNRTGKGVRTLIVCSCEWQPDDPGEYYMDMVTQHELHRIRHGLPFFDYSKVVFGEGPWMGLTWDEWYHGHRPAGDHNLDPYTGVSRPL